MWTKSPLLSTFARSLHSSNSPIKGHPSWLEILAGKFPASSMSSFSYCFFLHWCCEGKGESEVGLQNGSESRHRNLARMNFSQHLSHVLSTEIRVHVSRVLGNKSLHIFLQSLHSWNSPIKDHRSWLEILERRLGGSSIWSFRYCFFLRRCCEGRSGSGDAEWKQNSESHHRQSLMNFSLKLFCLRSTGISVHMSRVLQMHSHFLLVTGTPLQGAVLKCQKRDSIVLPWGK